MPKDDYVYLTRLSDPECELVCQRLRDAKIKYQIKLPPEGAPWNCCGAQYPSIGTEIYVLASELARARELLGLKTKDFSISKWRFSRGTRVFLFVIFLIWLLLIILGTTGLLSKLIPLF